jgi:hypothetical protein
MKITLVQGLVAMLEKEEWQLNHGGRINRADRK